MTSSLNVQVGQFVRTSDADGLGKVVALNDGKIDISYFRSITARDIQTYALADVRRHHLAPQSRVYIQDDDGNWRMGRVVEPAVTDGPRAYVVRFPNQEDRVLTEDRLEVRCLRPAIDPTEVLAAGGIETQFLHDRRQRALNALVAARAACRGLTGLLSASIELVPHQVEIVRRVLEDPIQRYLLADEVGLGKTVEAGVIIRQCLLDDQQARVVVLVPSPLVRQWRAELRDKLRLGDLLAEEDDFSDDFDESGEVELSDTIGSKLQILPFEALDQLRGEGVDLLVVDEAHHLVADDISGELRSAYPRLAQIAHASRRLLLLSATPILGDSLPMLALLHLLDPLAHPLEDWDGFRQKVARREELGKLQLSLRSIPSFRLPSLGQRLLDQMGDDETVVQLAQQFVANAWPDAEARQAAVARLRDHLAETYRLHQRLLRTRRIDAIGFESGRSGKLVADWDLDERTPLLSEALEEWRERAYRTVDVLVARNDEVGRKREAMLANRYLDLVGALGRGVEELADELARQRQGVERDELESFNGEARLLDELERALREENLEDDRLHMAANGIERVADALTLSSPGSQRRVVAFSSSTNFARTLAELLRDPRKMTRVFAILEGMSPAEVADELARFRACDRRGVLICDRLGEEGLNLQFADAILHLDLPFSLARIEQRIGRVDRYGRRAGDLMQRVIVVDDDGPCQFWLDVVRDGFGVFSNSISDVQFLLHDLETELGLDLFRGVHRLEKEGRQAAIARVQDALREERERLGAQYALNDLSTQDEEASRLFTTLQAVEEHGSASLAALDPWLTEALRFTRLRESGNEQFRLHWTEKTLLPEVPWRDLFAAALDRPLTYSREVALQHPGVALVRPGSALADAIGRFISWDDRGAVFATWRYEPAWPARDRGLWIGFRLCYVVEADVPRAAIDLDERFDRRLLPSLQRRADAYLAPWTETIDLSLDLQPVDAEVGAILKRPYDDVADRTGRRDYNLGSRQEALFDVVEPGRFEELCQRVRAHSEDLLRASDRFADWHAAALRRTREALSLRSDRLRQRQRALAREGAPSDPIIDLEIEVNGVILDAVESPRLRLDAIGLFVISDQPPTGEER